MSQLDTQTDVLVIGGGMAGACAALAASRESRTSSSKVERCAA